ncbi:MAG TPA: hypothetical protein VF844_14015 [Ktedonobacteraceae bacterium]
MASAEDKPITCGGDEQGEEWPAGIRASATRSAGDGAAAGQVRATLSGQPILLNNSQTLG